MSWRILIIGDVDTPTEWLHGIDGVTVDRREWSSAPAPIDGQADLVVPVALEEAQAHEMFERLRAKPTTVPVLAILPTDAPLELLHEASAIASDFVVWPAQPGEVHARIARILGGASTEADALCTRLLGEIGLERLVGRDQSFLRIIRQIPLMARSNRTVLITGETGTGKELCARAIHHLSRRRPFPFIPVECGGFPDQLFENEMFGHERGAFTDAHRRQRGLIAMAEGGTLFLDEIDSLSPASQAKLLRFLQERTYRPLGADRFVQADVNIVAASNRDLDALVREQHFRADLFFRLSVLRLDLIPLRARPGDIAILAQHFLDAMSAEEGAPRRTLAPAAIAALEQSAWPGNVRELHNVMQRAFVFAGGSQILAADVALAQRGSGEPPAPAAPAGAGTDAGAEDFRAARARAVEAFERQYVIRMLKAHQGNITQAARSAGQDRRAFGRLVKRYQIDRRVI
ncbi:MAG: sigma-54 dependent transcriptional regulator [Acidobacteriia bacterium]|nr:sigma-54 dependent transcriptional regulator [Terriglobia bacterium]